MKKQPLLFFISLFAVTVSAQKAEINIFPGDSLLIQTSQLWLHIRTLSHDSMMGRKPGTEGEVKTLKYLSAAFQKAGLKPAFGKSFLQPVKLLQSSSSGKFSFTANNRAFPVADSLMIMRTYSGKNFDRTGAEIVFAGYGIEAPEFGWSDYKNVNVSGKIVLVLEGEPADLRFRRDTTLKTSHHAFLFSKEDYARDRGASGIIVLCTYPFFYESEKWMFQKDFISLGERPRNNRLELFAWLCENGIKAPLAGSRFPLPRLKELADDSLFIPFILPVNFDVELETIAKPFTSYNVVGVIKGNHPSLKKESVIYTTHWDGFGIGKPENGDSIYNAAKDNAGGIAELISIAAAMTAAKDPPKRSVIFIASTAEEHGKLGAEAYTFHPAMDLRKTVCAVGMDIFSPWGKCTELVNESYGYTDMDSILAMLAAKKDLPYRGPRSFSLLSASDHYQFMRRGIPVVFASLNSQSPTLSRSVTDSINRISEPHTPFDEVCESWDLRSAAEEAELLFQLGMIIANSPARPKWKLNPVAKK